jgi:hypothetical protein
MRKSVFVFALMAAACSTGFAAEVTKDKAPVLKATTMSDAQMDKVTAGDAGGVPNLGGGQGHGWGKGAGIGAPGNGKGHGAANSNGRFGL